MLDYKNLGLFEIVKIYNNTVYKLDLSSLMNGLYPVFHPWLLHLVDGNPLSGQVNAPLSLVTVDNEVEIGEYYIKEILDFRIDGRRKDSFIGKKGYLMYKIKYLGYNEYNTTPEWQIFIDAVDLLDLVTDFYHRYLEKLGPHISFSISIE